MYDNSRLPYDMKTITVTNFYRSKIKKENLTSFYPQNMLSKCLSISFLNPQLNIPIDNSHTQTQIRFSETSWCFKTCTVFLSYFDLTFLVTLLQQITARDLIRI